MKTVLILCLVAGCWVANCADADSAEPGPVRPVVEKALRFLETDMVQWRNENGCAACHHGPMYLWSLSVAARQGFAVDRDGFQEMSTWLLTHDDARLLPPREEPLPAPGEAISPATRMTELMMGHKRLSQPAIYLTQALSEMPRTEPALAGAWQRCIEHLMEAQLDDGSWQGRTGRPPVFNTPTVLTSTALIGLEAHLAEITASQNGRRIDHSPRESLVSVVQRARDFLSDQPEDESHQGLVLRLLLAVGMPPSETRNAAVDRLVAELNSQQRPDGGWRQAADLESDAFATGQSLYALARAGQTRHDRVVGRGIEFLLRTQTEDGTWRMVSRPDPESGKRAENLNPITYAAAAWAVLGITTQHPSEAKR